MLNLKHYKIQAVSNKIGTNIQIQITQINIIERSKATNEINSSFFGGGVQVGLTVVFRHRLNN